MKQKTSKVLGIILMVAAVLVSIVGVIGILLLILPSISRTYYPLMYVAGLISMIALSAGLWMLSIWSLKFSKGKNKKGLLIGAIVLLAVYILWRGPLNNVPENLAEKGIGYIPVKEVTYNVQGLEYKLPAAWTKNPLQSGDGWEERAHFPFVRLDINQGFFRVYGFDCEFTDNDYTGDYRGFLTNWYSECKNYRIIDSSYEKNEKYNIAAQKQESYSSYDGQDFYDLSYLGEDRENGKMYLMQYRKYNGLTAEDYANFDVIIDHLK